MPTEIDRPPGWMREESPVPPVNHEQDDPFSESDDEDDEDASHWHNFDAVDDYDNFDEDEDEDGPPFCLPVNVAPAPTLPPPHYSTILNCNTTPDPYKLINDRKSKLKKTKPDSTDSDILIAFLEYFEKLGDSEGCPCRGPKGKMTIGKCTCLQILRDPDVRESLAYYCLAHGQKGYEDQHQRFIDWYRYYIVSMEEKKQSKTKYTDRPYLLPFDSSSMLSFDVKKVQSYKICTGALHAIFGIGRYKWINIMKAATTTGVAKKHGLKGIKRAIDDEEEVGQSLHSHFSHLMKLGEVRATRFVREETVDGGTKVVTRDDNDKEVFLPASTNGIRPCYYRWCLERGWEVEPTANGNCKKRAVKDRKAFDCTGSCCGAVGCDGGVGVRDKLNEICPFLLLEQGRKSFSRKVPIVSLATYYGFWKRHYPNLKVSSRAEDICVLCFQYANRRKFNLTNDNLYTDEGGGGGGGGDNDESEEESKIDREDSGDEEEECKEEEEPPPDDEITITITLPNIQDGEDEGLGDPDEVAPNPGDESAELMLLRAAKHIHAARSQRSLYQKLVRKAINDAKAKLQHKDRAYTLVVDYGQNMELPSFKSEQPGTVYYYSPLNIYNLGIVNHAHVYEGREDDPKAHMHAHVYHEGVAKKGMNNVCSLIMKTLSDLNMLREEMKQGKS